LVIGDLLVRLLMLFLEVRENHLFILLRVIAGTTLSIILVSSIIIDIGRKENLIITIIITFQRSFDSQVVKYLHLIDYQEAFFYHIESFEEIQL